MCQRVEEEEEGVMPKYKSPKCLYETALKHVAEIISDICPQHHSVVYDSLPSSVNEGLLKELQKETVPWGPDTIQRVQHVLYHSLRVINLRIRILPRLDGAPSALQSLLTLVSMHGDQLVELSLEVITLDKLDDSPLLAMLKFLRHLRRLTLFLRCVTDRVLLDIARHCEDLTMLKFYANNVTDRGLGALVACRKLLVVDFILPNIDNITCSSSCRLLLGLSNLRYLGSPFLTRALLQLPDTHRLALTEFDEFGLDNSGPLLHREETLSHIVRISPKLRRVDLYLNGSEVITPMGILQYLSELSLEVSVKPAEAFFRNQVEPVLEGIGGNLNALTLYISDLDVSSIVR